MGRPVNPALTDELLPAFSRVIERCPIHNTLHQRPEVRSGWDGRPKPLSEPEPAGPYGCGRGAAQVPFLPTSLLATELT